MESEEQKICPNCKREIPAVNFMTHTVHCARNIKVCPVCKEPVPLAELDEHHEKLHKLLPCKECGEKVCGTDLEDHVRDSCAHTIKSCRYCELELPRRDLPAHESYCGVRTEQCADCREWVMIKYRQLHLDSNHGFLRLDDDPVPQPKKELPKTTILPKTTNVKPTNLPQPSTSNGFLQPTTRYDKNTNILQDWPRTEIRYLGSSNIGPSTSSIENGLGIPSASISSPVSTQSVFNGISKPPKRTNDRPQINTAIAAAKKIEKEPISRGAVKKRPAPKPPTQPPNNDPKRELAYYSALKRSQEEEKKRQEQNAYNLAHGLPPVLTPAAKLEKLRKMDALHNREVEDTDYKNRLQGRVWMDHSYFTAGHVLGSENYENNVHLEAERRRNDRPSRANQPANSADTRHSPELEDRRDEFRDLKPMTPQEFMNRFQELQLRKDGGEDTAVREGDRFSQIKSSLRELRRGLNEVTAPYNTTNLNAANNSERNRRRSPVRQDSDEVELPCEFCGVPVPASDLVQHQTGCRPDLARLRPHSAPPSPPPAAPRPRPPPDPVIPCEFCAQALPVYLISEHQERCGRESNRLFAD